MSYRRKHSPSKPAKPKERPSPCVEYGSTSDLRMLPSRCLTSGLAFQRRVREADVRRLVREWNDGLFKPLAVNFRDGRFNLIDGQHRLTALHRMNEGNDVMVLCRVYNNLTYEQEAELFYKLDKAKKPMSMAQSTKALLESNADPKTRQINFLLNQAGFVWALGKDHGGSFEVTVSQSIINAYELTGADLFLRMMRLIRDTWEGDPASVSAAMLSGMALFLKTYETELDDAVFARRLSAADPGKIVQRGKEDFSTDNKVLRTARAILERYNKAQRGGRKLKYRFGG